MNPEERRRRQIASFCRWLMVYRRHDTTTRMAIESLAKSIDAGEQRGVERDSALDSMDELLFGGDSC